MNPSTPAPVTAVTAALVSVGGSPAPVLHVLRQHKPAHVWYFCSAGSRVNADAIQQQLDWHPQARFIEVERFEELGPCYRELRRKIPEILAETKIPSSEVLVDYTGGTKTMSAALVLAATEMFNQFSYVGGEQRKSGGLGITVDGTERVHYQGNPWSALAVREVERARDLWAGCQFEVSARALRDVASHDVPKPLRFLALADFADAMAARHRLDFGAAVKRLGSVKKSLALLFDGGSDHGLIPLTSECLDICLACSREAASDTFLRELLDNTLRTAAQGRYEDAAARLYRAMEMQGQIWLATATNGLFTNGKCKPDNVTKIPDSLKKLEFFQPIESDEIKWSLEQIFHALAALESKPAQAIVADIALPTKGRWRSATDKRNSGILAHGVNAVGAEGFDNMKDIAADFLGFDLKHEANPIPPLEPAWLE